MKRIFLDTNFILDYFVRSEYKPASEALLQRGLELKVKFYVSYLTVANFAYIVRKIVKDPSDRLFLIKSCCELFNVATNKKSQIDQAILLNPKDFEDGLQYMAALDANCDCIVSRNIKDFSFSRLPVLSPIECLEQMG